MSAHDGPKDDAGPAMTVAVSALTHFEVSPCGSCVRLGLLDHQGEAKGLALPFRCLGMLLMTLPSMIEQAIRRQSMDPTMRHVFPLEGWEVEVARGTGQAVLVLSTGNGFKVRFALPRQNAIEIGEKLKACSELLDREPRAGALH
jgi:hypothetical protein